MDFLLHQLARRLWHFGAPNWFGDEKNDAYLSLRIIHNALGSSPEGIMSRVTDALSSGASYAKSAAVTFLEALDPVPRELVLPKSAREDSSRAAVLARDMTRKELQVITGVGQIATGYGLFVVSNRVLSRVFNPSYLGGAATINRGIKRKVAAAVATTFVGTGMIDSGGKSLRLSSKPAPLSRASKKAIPPK